MHEYIGAIHIHSIYSDGLRPIPEIAEIAAKSNIDFLMFADHNTTEPFDDGMERWFGSVLSIIGYEINDPDNKNHYLVFGLEELVNPRQDAREYVKEVKKQGGLGFIAHPDEKRSAIPAYPPYPWTQWGVTEFDGIEIWNHASEWLEKLTHSNKYFHVLHPLKYLKGPEPETLRRWDDLNMHHPVPGIGGIDAHAYPYRLGPITIYIFRYKVLFKGIRTHVLLDKPIQDDVAEAKASVLGALKSSRCFISNFRWGDAKTFSFRASADNTTYNMGDTIAGEHAAFTVNTPLKSTIKLIRNGFPIAETTGTSLTHETTESGAYRVEVRRKSKPWIYSNHIRLQGVTDNV